MKITNRSGFTGVEVVVVLAILAGAAWLFKPSIFPGASKRAQQSTLATAKVEQATANVDAATNAQDAAAAASVAKIGEANSAAPASPARDFISREVPVALAKLPPPDTAALLESERRRVAVMEGRADEARRLYEAESKKAEQLQHERDAALAERNQAMTERRAADLALEQAAAAEHALKLQRLGGALILILLLAAYAYAKVYSITPRTLGMIAADVRSGVNPISAMDTHLAPWLHKQVNTASRLATPHDDEREPSK